MLPKSTERQIRLCLPATFGLLNGDTLDGTLVVTTDASDRSDVGFYVTHAEGVSSPNYDVTYIDGSLAVTPAAITASVINSTKVYGSNNPDFAVTYNGLLDGDSLGIPLFSTATGAGSVGEYAVVASGLSSPNYSVTLVAGSLSVSRKAHGYGPQLTTCVRRRKPRL